jgi:hypothetical protein
MSNLLRTEGGLVWSDLEDVCAGPVAWDLGGLVASARSRGSSPAFTDEVIAAYGDPGVSLREFLDAHDLYDVIWQASEANRKPRALKTASASLARLRGARPN